MVCFVRFTRGCTVFAFVVIAFVSCVFFFCLLHQQFMLLLVFLYFASCSLSLCVCFFRGLKKGCAKINAQMRLFLTSHQINRWWPEKMLIFHIEWTHGTLLKSSARTSLECKLFFCKHGFLTWIYVFIFSNSSSSFFLNNNFHGPNGRKIYVYLFCCANPHVCHTDTLTITAPENETKWKKNTTTRDTNLWYKNCFCCFFHSFSSSAFIRCIVSV